MSKIVRLTESDLIKLVKRVINEQNAEHATFGFESKDLMDFGKKVANALEPYILHTEIERYGAQSTYFDFVFQSLKDVIAWGPKISDVINASYIEIKLNGYYFTRTRSEYPTAVVSFRINMKNQQPISVGNFWVSGKNILDMLKPSEKYPFDREIMSKIGGLKIGPSKKPYTPPVTSKVSPTMWKSVVDYLKKNNVQNYKFKGFVENIETEGVEMINQSDRTLELTINPDKTYNIFKLDPSANSGRGTEEGNWEMTTKGLILKPSSN